MHCWTGQDHYTSFESDKLYRKLKTYSPKCRRLLAKELYLYQDEKTLTGDEEAQVRAILEATPFQPIALPQFWITPRFGTTTPWSTKASNILSESGIATGRLERIVWYVIDGDISEEDLKRFAAEIADPMTQSLVYSYAKLESLFHHSEPKTFSTIPILTEGKNALIQANTDLGLALSEDDLDYLVKTYSVLKRNMSDVELMMFAQVNSEHCRHKIFKAKWQGKEGDISLFDMIRNTHACHPEGILSAYSDNAAVIEGFDAERLDFDPMTGVYSFEAMAHPIQIKVETHNHPTAISPFPGAATGAGGEIRDEAACGVGARSKAGLVGFCTSHLNIPDFEQPWEIKIGKPNRIVSSLGIMLDAPIGAASFNNEFGRPSLCGYFRTFELILGTETYGYHKPIMLAGGMGNIRESHIHKKEVPAGARLVALGGPAMLIGLGGGAASSMSQGESDEDLDFASVQRENPEMQRRAQAVIDTCTALGEKNPILSLHDVGAGGFCNAFPEIVHDAGMGAEINLRHIATDEPGMSPLEIWCNEAQERFVLAIAEEHFALFALICQRERAPMQDVGVVTKKQNLKIYDSLFDNYPVDIPLAVLFGNTPQMTKNYEPRTWPTKAIKLSQVDLKKVVFDIVSFPAVANKNFLVTIGDRSVGGLTARDQMIGQTQMPLSDVAVTATGFTTHCGEAMALGERPAVALIDPKASAKLAVAEAITNIMAADIESLGDISLSANWMAASGERGMDAALFDMVEEIGKSFCPELGIAIPVGKDSLSMKTVWDKRKVISPVSLNVTAFSKVNDIRKTLTPLMKEVAGTALLYVNLAENMALGGSVFEQVHGTLGGKAPKILAKTLKNGFQFLRELKDKEKVLAYHDSSDGGLFMALLEMAFVSRQGLRIELPEGIEPIECLFHEGAGFLIQCRTSDVEEISEKALTYGVQAICIAEPTGLLDIKIHQSGIQIFEANWIDLMRRWVELSYKIELFRDNPTCVEEAYEDMLSEYPNYLNPLVEFTPSKVPMVTGLSKPRVGILREQGVNSHYEMAAAFTLAGFEAVDIHVSDLKAGRRLDDLQGLAAAGGFSYGDVLGAGRGWALSILQDDSLCSLFQMFFARENTFTLGICNGCQMLSQLKELIPGADHFPRFLKNRSNQFEARLSQVRIEKTTSIFLQGMEGSVLPIVVSHGEGRVAFANRDEKRQARMHSAMTFVDASHRRTMLHPANPNGTEEGMTAFCSVDGRVLIAMPHPERSFRTSQLSWHPADWPEMSPWFELFVNARKWVD